MSFCWMHATQNKENILTGMCERSSHRFFFLIFNDGFSNSVEPWGYGILVFYLYCISCYYTFSIKLMPKFKFSFVKLQLVVRFVICRNRIFYKKTKLRISCYSWFCNVAGFLPVQTNFLWCRHCVIYI